MSNTLNTENHRPSPEFLTRMPPFKKGGLLPRDWQEVNRNHHAQQRTLERVHEKEERAANAEHRGYARRCLDILHITLCFDGTNNHEPSDKLTAPPSTSNVAPIRSGATSCTLRAKKARFRGLPKGSGN